MRTAVQGVVHELWARRTRLALLIPLEAAGVVALFTALALFDGILWRPLRFPAPNALVAIWHGQPTRGITHLAFSLDEARFYRHEATSLESSVAFTMNQAFVTDGDAPEAIRVVEVLGDLCHTLRVPPIAGRCLTDADAAPGAPRVAVIRAARAKSRYDDPAHALGRSVRIEDQPHVIVGVVRDDLDLRAFGGYVYGLPGYMVPLRAPDTGTSPSPGAHMLTGRLAPMRTLSEAASELEALSRAYAAQMPNSNEGKVAAPWPLRDETVQYAAPQSRALIAGAILLAVLVLFNSALLRATDLRRRRSTLAVKAALGASTRRLAGEELAVALGATAVIGFAAWSMASVLVARFVRTEPWGLPGLRQEAFPLYFAIALALVCGVGTIASLVFMRRQMVYGDGVGMLPSRAIGESRASGRWSRAMVAAQCTMAVVLVGATLLLLKTMWNLAQVDVGLRTENLLIVETRLPTRLAETPSQRQLMLDRLLDTGTLSATGGSIAVVNALPLALRGSEVRRVDVAGVRQGTAASTTVNYRVISPNYFEVAGIRLLSGRVPGAHAPNRGAELVVNDTFVRRFLDGREPIGVPVRVLPSFGEGGGVELEGAIVGVIADVRHWGLDRPASAELYVPYRADPPARFTVLLRPAGSAVESAGALREHLRTIAPELAAFPVSTMTAIAHESLGLRRFASTLFGIFAAVAILVTSLGLYGLASGYVTARRAEIAVRMSIGAGRKSVATLVAGQSLLPAAIGCLVGTVTLMAAGRLLRSWLYEVSPTDPVLLLLLPLFMVTVAIVATLGPLVSALRVLPIELLRAR